MNNLSYRKSYTVSASRQNIMMYLKAYQPVLEISKDGLHTLNQVILDDEVSVGKKRLLVTLFKKVHEFLQQFCKGNETNQEILAEEKEKFLTYAHLDVGQIDLLCNIFEGNKGLCDKIQESFLEKFVSLIESEGRQAIFLKFFMVIQRSKDSYILENQIKVFRALINNDENDHEKTCKVLYVTKQSNSEEIQFQFEDYLSTLENKDLVDKLEEYGFRDTYRDEPFIYHEQLLSVLIETMRGSEGLNMNKAKLSNLFSLQYLLELLLYPDSLTSTHEPNILQDSVDPIYNLNPSVIGSLGLRKITSTKKVSEAFEEKKKGFSKIKKKVVDFIKETYFTTGAKITEEISHNVSLFIKLIENEISRLESITETTSFDPTFTDYFFGSLLNLCNVYITKFLNEAILEESGRRKDNLVLYKLANVMIKKVSIFEEALKPEHLTNIKTFLRNYLDDSVVNYEEKLDALLLREEEDNSHRKGNIGDEIEEDEEDFTWASKKGWERVMNILTSNGIKWEKVIKIP